jgi:hypothetical protein
MKSVDLTDRLPAIRRKYGAELDAREMHELHLRELPDGRKQVVRYRGRAFAGQRDASGVEVLAETLGSWESIGCAT